MEYNSDTIISVGTLFLKKSLIRICKSGAKIGLFFGLASFC